MRTKMLDNRNGEHRTRSRIGARRETGNMLCSVWNMLTTQHNWRYCNLLWGEFLYYLYFMMTTLKERQMWPFMYNTYIIYIELERVAVRMRNQQPTPPRLIDLSVISSNYFYFNKISVRLRAPAPASQQNCVVLHPKITWQMNIEFIFSPALTRISGARGGCLKNRHGVSGAGVHFQHLRISI